MKIIFVGSATCFRRRRPEPTGPKLAQFLTLGHVRNGRRGVPDGEPCLQGGIYDLPYVDLFQNINIIDSILF